MTLLTAHLKKHFPIEFMTALLTMEENEEKLRGYIKKTEEMGIPIRVPDINLSGVEFTPVNGSILFGLGSVKGVGKASLPGILKDRPYASVEDATSRLPKKIFNKSVGIALIKSGAFDFYNKNRYESINEFYDTRKDKDDRYEILDYDEVACNEFEESVLGAPITYKPWWDTVETDSTVEMVMEIISVFEKTDRNGRLMAFVEFKCRGCAIKSVIFSSYYRKFAGALDKERYTHALVKGRKDDKGSLVVTKVTEYKGDSEIHERFSEVLA